MTTNTRSASEQFKLLAEKAGVKVEGHWYFNSWERKMVLPGAVGGLSHGHVSTVLTWLVKTGHNIEIYPDETTGKAIELTIEEHWEVGHGKTETAYGDTLPEALYAAVMELEL